VATNPPCLELFAGVNEVGFLFHLAPLVEAQNAGMIEQLDAFFSFGLANSDSLNESFGIC
jgi:hypothetical protein